MSESIPPLLPASPPPMCLSEELDVYTNDNVNGDFDDFVSCYTDDFPCKKDRCDHLMGIGNTLVFNPEENSFTRNRYSLNGDCVSDMLNGKEDRSSSDLYSTTQCIVVKDKNDDNNDDHLYHQSTHHLTTNELGQQIDNASNNHSFATAETNDAISKVNFDSVSEGIITDISSSIQKYRSKDYTHSSYINVDHNFKTKMQHHSDDTIPNNNSIIHSGGYSSTNKMYSSNIDSLEGNFNTSDPPLKLTNSVCSSDSSLKSDYNTENVDNCASNNLIRLQNSVNHLPEFVADVNDNNNDEIAESSSHFSCSNLFAITENKKCARIVVPYEFPEQTCHAAAIFDQNEQINDANSSILEHANSENISFTQNSQNKKHDVDESESVSSVEMGRCGGISDDSYNNDTNVKLKLTGTNSVKNKDGNVQTNETSNSVEYKDVNFQTNETSPEKYDGDNFGTFESYDRNTNVINLGTSMNYSKLEQQNSVSNNKHVAYDSIDLEVVNEDERLENKSDIKFVSKAIIGKSELYDNNLDDITTSQDAISNTDSRIEPLTRPFSYPCNENHSKPVFVEEHCNNLNGSKNSDTVNNSDHLKCTDITVEVTNSTEINSDNIEPNFTDFDSSNIFYNKNLYLEESCNEIVDNKGNINDESEYDDDDGFGDFECFEQFSGNKTKNQSNFPLIVEKEEDSFGRFCSSHEPTFELSLGNESSLDMTESNNANTDFEFISDTNVLQDKLQLQVDTHLVDKSLIGCDSDNWDSLFCLEESKEEVERNIICVEGRLNVSLVWCKLRDFESSPALMHQWSNSVSNKMLLSALSVDSRNILFGPRWSSEVPRFAANLGFTPLVPEKANSHSPDPTPIAVDSIVESSMQPSNPPFDNIKLIPKQLPDIRTNTMMDMKQVPDAHFDWNNSGLVNPLDNNKRREKFHNTREEIPVFENTVLQKKRISAKAEEILNNLPNLVVMERDYIVFPTSTAKL